jgi:hypothetical protein
MPLDVLDAKKHPASIYLERLCTLRDYISELPHQEFDLNTPYKCIGGCAGRLFGVDARNYHSLAKILGLPADTSMFRSYSGPLPHKQAADRRLHDAITNLERRIYHETEKELV